jgi:MFS family permease
VSGSAFLAAPAAGTSLASARDAQQWWLLVATAVAVVSDTMLGPFYPRLFAQAFGVTDPQHVGTYLAATCLTVMVAFPFWAWVEKRVPTLWLLVFTQLAAGLLSLVCSTVTGLVSFWSISLTMIAFKGSYLLIYPYLMRIQHKEKHAQLIGILTVIVHLGGITGATFGGFVLESFTPQRAFLFMALGDFVQIGGCIWLLLRWPVSELPSSPKTRDGSAPKPVPTSFLLKLCLVMVVFYFSAFLGRPFFAEYWTDRAHNESALLSGLVFSIPGWISVGCVWHERKFGAKNYTLPGLLAVGIVGIGLQLLPHPVAIILGRVVFGFSLFYLMVKLDLLLFEASTPESYAVDFSRINFCQQLGVLVAFYVAGALVAQRGLWAPIALGVFGFAVTALLCARLLPTRTSEQKDLASP